MGHENNRAAVLCHILHFSKALLLKRDVTDSQHLIDEQDFRFKMRRYRECQAGLHPRAVMLQRSVKKSFDLRERDDLVELSLNFRLLHSQYRASQENVLASTEFRMEASPHLKQASDAPL